MKALLLLLVALALASGFRIRYVPEFEETPNAPPEQYFTQRLTHFGKQDQRTWQQRYFVNDTFYNPNLDGPIFLIVGGEGAISPGYVVSFEIARYAQKYGALMVALEHRFYGKSKPLPTLATDNLHFLTSEEALADLAHFITSFKQERNINPDTPVVTFGGSYPGNLAAWFRMKYPHLTVGAVASSAPVLAELDFYQYLDVVKNSLTSEAGIECTQRIQQATKVLQEKLGTPEGRTDVEKQFKVCKPMTDHKHDITTLMSITQENFMGVVQYNNRDGTTVSIKSVCAMMTNKSHSPIEAYAQVSNMFLDMDNKKCLDVSYASVLSVLKDTKQPETGVGMRSWVYQTCVEFAYFQTTSSPNQPFGNLVPLDYSLDICKDVYGFDFIPNVNITNTYYGGRNPQGATRILFVNGSLDPWHALSVTQSLTSTLRSILIEGTSHCAEMRPARPHDPPGLAKAQAEIQQIVGEWITAFPFKK